MQTQRFEFAKNDEAVRRQRVRTLQSSLAGKIFAAKSFKFSQCRFQALNVREDFYHQVGYNLFILASYMCERGRGRGGGWTRSTGPESFD